MIGNMEQLFEAIREDNRQRQVGVMFALPMFGGVCHGDFALALMRTTALLGKLGYKVSVQAMYNESLITRARNNLAMKFMDDPSMDLLMMIDSDIVFGEYDVLRLILADRDFAGGVYPRKALNWDGIKAAVKADKDKPEDWSCSYLFNAVDMGHNETDEDGLVEVTHAATGFLLVKRKVFTKLQGTAPVYDDVINGQKVRGYDYFRCGVGPNGKYTSEDYWFCNEWRNTGGKIYINPFIRLGHIGTYTFNGNLARMGMEPI